MQIDDRAHEESNSMQIDVRVVHGFPFSAGVGCCFTWACVPLLAFWPACGTSDRRTHQTMWALGSSDRWMVIVGWDTPRRGAPSPQLTWPLTSAFPSVDYIAIYEFPSVPTCSRMFSQGSLLVIVSVGCAVLLVDFEVNPLTKFVSFRNLYFL